VVKEGCKVVVHGIWAILDAHLDWVVLYIDIVNAFNTICVKPSLRNFGQGGLIVTTFSFCLFFLWHLGSFVLLSSFFFKGFVYHFFFLWALIMMTYL
jgi:hypothetical protein